MLICVSPPLTHVFGQAEREALYEASFGDIVVPVRFIQAGVLKCNAPPHPSPGFVPLSLLRSGESISTAQTCSFEYRSQVPQKQSQRKIKVRGRDRPGVDELVSGGSQEQNNMFKVRVIEKLQYLNSRCENCTHTD